MACNEADRDSRTEPVLLPEGFSVDAGADDGNTQVIYQGYVSEPNPVPPATDEDADRFSRTDFDPDVALTPP